MPCLQTFASIITAFFLTIGATAQTKAGGAEIEVTGAPGHALSVGAFEPGVKLFADRAYVLKECPDNLRALPFLRVGIDGCRITVTQEGELLAVTPESDEHRSSQVRALEAYGFVRVETPPLFQLFGNNPIERVRLYRKTVRTGERYTFRKAAILLGFGKAADAKPQPWSENAGETLYNGIRLPAVWPPEHLQPASVEPMPVPYLEHPPQTIPIDVGRQLFVDDFLIQDTSLTRTFHRAEKYEGNPVFKPETEEEIRRDAAIYLGHGGVFFDPEEQLFKMFYVAGWRGDLALATSTDMRRWNRPELGFAGGNRLLPPGPQWTGPEIRTAGTDNCVWLDVAATNRSERLKYLTCWMHVPGSLRPKGFNHSLQASADGRTWSPARPTGEAEDYCSFFFNPFRNVWAFSIKQGGPRGRCRYYAENADFLNGADWSQSVYWTNADKLDAPEPEGRYPGAGEPPQLYSLNAVAYESLLIGMHYILRGPNNAICNKGQFPKLIDLELGFSRDGFHWHRPDRQGFITGERKEGAWDRAYLHSTAGVCVILDDTLVFPYTGFSGIAPDGSRGMYTGASIGIATLRRDGFASLDADEKGGTLTTRPVTFSGRQLFVNVACPQGELRAEILDADGKVIEPFTLANSQAFKGDSTCQRMSWTGGDAYPTGRPVRFRFHLASGSLYAFWVSRDASGASGGFLAAGSLNQPRIKDTP